MEIQDAQFVSSYTRVQECPKSDQQEYAFIGRSNVGKSSLINMLTNRKKLARISVTPGKTQLINFFLINKDWHLVDLPGYGYAKVSKTSRKNWEKMIRDYLVKRENLQCVFVLIDSRLEPQKIDLDFVNWLGEMQVPFALVFTKADKPSKNKLNQNIHAFKETMLRSWEELPDLFVTSSANKLGREELLAFIEGVNKR